MSDPRDELLKALDEIEAELNQVKIIPEGAGEPLPPVPDVVTISETDIERALKQWDKLMPDYAGMLDNG